MMHIKSARTGVLPYLMVFKLFSLIFKQWFLNGLAQDTVIGELVSCVISETRSIKREYMCDASRRAQITVKLSGHRSFA